MFWCIFSDIHSITAVFWCIFSDIHSITAGFWCIFSDIHSITAVFWYIFSDIHSITAGFCYIFRHTFHKSCVEPWLIEQRSCPMCKLDILKAYGLQVSYEIHL